VQAGNAAKTRPDVSIKLQQSWPLRRWRVATQAVDEAAMPRACPQQAEANLRVFQRRDCIQKLLACLHPLQGMPSHKVRGASGSPQQIKVAKHTAVAMHVRQQLCGEIGGEGSRRGWPNSNKLTLVQIQSEAHRPRNLLEGLETLANRKGIACYHSII
jgi:hypothetical protein